MPSKKETAPSTAQVEADVKPELTVVHKFNVRDLQLKSQTAHVNTQTWTQNAKTADENFSGYINKMVQELKVDVAKWQLNLDTLEFSPRETPAPVGPALEPAPAPQAVQ
jgi:hypothetical protein